MVTIDKIKSQNLSVEQYIQLKDLRQRIDVGSANIAEYKQFENLLNLVGITNDDIKEKLNKYNIESLTDFYTKREINKRKKNNRDIEGVILGAILGLAIIVLFAWALDKRQEENA